jgi:hypothetical protein
LRCSNEAANERGDTKQKRDKIHRGPRDNNHRMRIVTPCNASGPRGLQYIDRQSGPMLENPGNTPLPAVRSGRAR